MDNRTAGERGWGLAEATRQLLKTAGPAEAETRDPQVARAITSFLAQPAGSVTLDDARADQTIILAQHFGVDEAYFTDPDVARSGGARRGQGTGRGPDATAGRHRRPVDDEPVAVEAPPRPRRPAVVGVAVAVLVGALGGGFVGYRAGGGADRPVSSVAAASPDARHDSAGQPLQTVVDKALPGVVQVRVHAGNKMAVGSGIVLTPDGLLLVNDHVIASAAHPGQISIAGADGTPRPAHLVGRNPASDLAVLATENPHGLTPVTLGDSDAVHIGERVVAVGPVLDRGGVIASGAVSAVSTVGSVGRADQPGHRAANAPAPLGAIRTDAVVTLDNSGAPLVDPAGLVVGVETVAPGINMIPGPDGLTALASAIPINQAVRIADQLIESSRAVPTVLGVRVGRGNPLRPLRPHEDSVGAKLVAITPGSPASDAGLKAGDTVVEMNGRPVTSGDELVAATKALTPGSVVTVRLHDGRVARLSLDRPPAVASQVTRRQSCGHACTPLSDATGHPAHPGAPR